MNVIDYITITCNLKNVRLQITFDYMKNVIDYNRLRLPHVWLMIALFEIDLENTHGMYDKYNRKSSPVTFS